MRNNNQSRIKNSLRNSKWRFLYKIIFFFFPFFIKRIIIQKLGIEYLGLSGLFSSVLSVLSLAELGFNTAIVYSLYKPVSENNISLVCSILSYFRKIYRIIGITILTLGLIISPFLSYFIKGEIPSDVNIYILYYIYLFNTSVSYFLFSYRGCIFSAFQRNDIETKITMITNLFMYVIQLVVLFLFNNYYTYVIVIPISTIISNLFIYIFAKTYFPEYTPNGIIDLELRKKIKSQVKGILVGRICSVLESALDVIIISWLIGLRDVAIYNNYLLVMNGLIGILAVIPDSMKNSIGNSVATESVAKNYNDYVKFNFIYMYIVGIVSVCMFCLYQDFMTLWIGKDYLFSLKIVILICIHFYILKIGDFTASYFSSNGLWEHAKTSYLLEIITNITLNIILGRLFGIIGILLSTIIALGLTNIFLIPILLNKYYFKKKIVYHFLSVLFYFIAISFVAFVLNFIFRYIQLPITWWTFVIKGGIIFIISAILLLLIYMRLPYYKSSIELIKNVIKNILKK